MEILRATEADSDKLKSFFERMMLPGAIDFSIRRTGSFFDQYRVFSDDFVTVILKDDAGEIVGMASMLFREGIIQNEKQTWGYATDLRIAPTRKAIAQWAQRFLPVMESECAARECRFVFSAVELHDNQAYNALIRPTSHTRRKLPRYHLVNRFRVVALHGRLPFSSRPLTSIRLRAPGLNDVEPLCAYLTERGKKRSIAGVYTPEVFLKELSCWPGLKLSDFRIAHDARDRILGCSALWDGRTVQNFVPQTYRGFARTLHQGLSIGNAFGITRKLAKPGQPMPNKFLTHLSADSSEVFHRIVDDAFSRLGPKEFLSYMHFRGNWRTLPPKGFICSSLPFGFYLILPPNVEVPTWRTATPGLQHLPPDFEIAWI
jgi:hypothetical protein